MSNLQKLKNFDLGELEKSLKDTDLDLNTLSEEERSVLFKILSEYADQGQSDTLNLLWKQDYEEIPVDIETFLCDPHYLGKSTDGGTSIFPFWMDVLKEIFKKDAKYWEVILTGGIGLGKTTIADYGIAYMMYRLMCLRDPARYYDLTSGSILIVAFFNVTLTLSKGVAFRKLQGMLMNSPWFMSRGQVRGTKDEVYSPKKDIDFTVGSTERHGLGSDIFCLTGDTEILTSRGLKVIDRIKDEEIRVYSYDRNGNIVLSNPCTVLDTATVDEIYEIEFDEGVTIKCTGDHQWLTKCDQTGIECYLNTRELREGDNIVSFKSY